MLKYLLFRKDNPVEIKWICPAADSIVVGTFLFSVHTGRWLVCQHNPEEKSVFTHWWQELTEAQVPNSYKGQALLLS